MQSQKSHPICCAICFIYTSGTPLISNIKLYQCWILENTPFKNIYIPSAGHDAGTSIGSALYLYNQILGKKRLPETTTAYFGKKSTQQEIINAANLANAHDFIMDFPQGYSTRLEERGTNVSGCQLQRIAIARAVLGNPAVLLLDEATSALDADAEQAVKLGLKQAMKGRTVVVIAHRLSTVQEADLIVVLDKGRICDLGSHDELMRRKGRYRELCEKQFIRNF